MTANWNVGAQARLSQRIINKNLNPAPNQFRLNDRLNHIPGSAREPAADTRHVNGCFVLGGEGTDRRKPPLNRVVADRWISTLAFDAVLSD